MRKSLPRIQWRVTEGRGLMQYPAESRVCGGGLPAAAWPSAGRAAPAKKFLEEVDGRAVGLRWKPEVRGLVLQQTANVNNI